MLRLIIVGLSSFIFSIAGSAFEMTQKITKFSRELMGTEVLILVDAQQDDALQNAVRKTFNEGERLNMIFSDYEANSEVSRFSKTSGSGKSFKLSKELFEVLDYAQGLSVVSDGAFDVTLGPLSRLWRIARFQKKLPSPTKLSHALSRVGHGKLLLDPTNLSARLELESMVVDLGAVAKGYIADQMLGVMKDCGYPRCLIDAGGDLTIGSSPRNRTGWKIKIGGQKHPDLPTLSLANCAVATSGDLEQSLEINGKSYSHIIDPQSGYGLARSAQATVIAPTCMIADSLASTSLVLGFNKSVSFLPQTDFMQLFYLSKSEGSNEILTYSREQKASK